MLLLAGCAQQVLRPEINDATIRLLARNGVDVVVPPGAGCCGALVHHMGKEAGAVAQAKQNVDAWWKVNEREPIDAIIINASGCGTTVKDYGHLLRHEPDYAERAATLAALALDVTEFLTASISARRAAGRACASPIIRPARCSTVSASRASRRHC